MNLDDALQELRQKRSTLQDAGLDGVREARGLYNELQRHIDRYRDDATGRGDFESYIEFQSALAEIEDRLHPGVYGEQHFRQALDRFESRTLREKHFRRAENDLREVKGVVEALERALELEDELRNMEGRLRKRKREIKRDISDLESRIQDARQAPDVDASRLRSLIDEYNKAVERDYESFLSNAPSADVVRHAYRTSRMPLIESNGVDRGAVEAMEDSRVGSESVEKLLEYADYSDSKLRHYVDDPGTFRDRLPMSWFRTADAEPYKLSPELEEGVVEHLVPELVSVVSEFASERTVEHLRRIADLARRGEYSRMRESLQARQKTGGKDVEALRDEKESVEEELDRVERKLERIDEALSEELQVRNR